MSTEYAAVILEVRPLDGFKVSVSFDNGETKIIDLEPHLRGPMFELLRNPNLFRQIFADESGALAWPNGADICPDLLYYDGPPPWAKRFLQKSDRTK